MTEPTIQQRIEQAKKRIRILLLDQGIPEHKVGKHLEWWMSELSALLKALQDEQKFICRIKANRAGCSKEVDSAIEATPYAYEPTQEEG